MEIGIPTRWLYPEHLEGRKIEGVFTGTNPVETKKGNKIEAVIFVCNEAEYQIAPWNLVCETKFEVKDQRAELSKQGSVIRVKLL